MKSFHSAGGRSRHFSLSLFVCLSVFITNAEAMTAPEKPSTTASTERKISGPYCGLYCLYTVMRLSDLEVDFRALVKPEYIGSPRGSSLAELKKAAEDHGLYAVPVRNLTSRVLRNCPYPAILHVKPNAMSQTYRHYELFLGTQNGKAGLFNPPEPIRWVPFRELAPRADGNGLIISSGAVDLAVVFAPARKAFAVYAAITVAAILIVRLAGRWLPQALFDSYHTLLRLSVAQGAALGMAALLCGMIYHFANDEGLLANAPATASIQRAHVGNFIRKIGSRTVRKLLHTNTVFIDARFARDYRAGHLQGAINVPVDVNDVKRQKATAEIAKDARIVVYCQSSGCRYAETVATKLVADGFSHISIFRGGWAEWVERNGKTKQASS